MPNKFNRVSDQFKDYVVVEQLDDPRFGTCFLLEKVQNGKPVDGKKILMKEYLTNSEKDAQNHVKILQERKELDHDTIQKLHDWSSEEKSDFCSKYYKLRAYYTYPVDNMADMMAKLKPNQSMDHETLTHIMYQMLNALSYLHRHDKYFNDVRPVFVGSLEKTGHRYILCDRLKMPGDAVQVQRQYFETANKRLFMSPQLWKIVNASQKEKLTHLPYKSDVWSLGMSLLIAGLGLNIKDQNSIYVKRTKDSPAKVNMVKLQEYIHKFKEIYEKENNHILGNCVQECLVEDEQHRKSASELYAELPNYHEVCEHFIHGDKYEVEIEVERPPQRPEPQVIVQPPREVIVQPPREVVVPRSPAKEIISEVIVRDTKVIHEESHDAPIRNVIKKEPRVIREYIDIHGNRSTVAPDYTHHHGQQYTSEVVHQEIVRDPVVVNRESHAVHREPTVVTRDPVVVRESHHPQTVRRSHVGEVRRIEGDVRRVEGEVRRVEGEVRRVEGEVRRVEGGVRREPVTTVVEDVVRTGEVRRIEGDVRRVEGEVRRVEGGVVRRSAHEGAVVRRSHQQVGGVTYGTAHAHQTVTHGVDTSNVRIIKDPAEVAAYKAKMTKSGTEEVVVEREVA